MAVTKVYGKANSAEVVFSSDGGDVWTVSVPTLDDGEYVVEIYAEDEAGNTAYLCTMLFVATGHKLTISIVPRGYGAAAATNGYSGDPSTGGIRAAFATSTGAADAAASAYTVSLATNGIRLVHKDCRED